MRNMVVNLIDEHNLAKLVSWTRQSGIPVLCKNGRENLNSRKIQKFTNKYPSIRINHETDIIIREQDYAVLACKFGIRHAKS